MNNAMKNPNPNPKVTGGGGGGGGVTGPFPKIDSLFNSFI